MSNLNQMLIAGAAEFAAIFGGVTGDAVVAESKAGIPNEPAGTRKSRRDSNFNVEAAAVQKLGSDRQG